MFMKQMMFQRKLCNKFNVSLKKYWNLHENKKFLLWMILFMQQFTLNLFSLYLHHPKLAIKDIVLIKPMINMMMAVSLSYEILS